MNSPDEYAKGSNEALDPFTDDALAHFGNRIECLIITGSYARDDVQDQSDIDLWLFLDFVSPADLDAIADLLERRKGGPELNVQCTTFDELAHFGGAMNPLQLHVEGKIIHGQLRFDPPNAEEICEQARHIAADVLMSARHYLTAREPDTALADGKLMRFLLKPLMLALRYDTRARTGVYPRSLDELSRCELSDEARGLVDIRHHHLGATLDIPCRPIVRQAERVALALVLSSPRSNAKTSASPVVMGEFDLLAVDDAPQARAPDGSRVRVLLRTDAASMAQFELEPGACSKAISHHTVDELWFVLSGHGELWRANNGREEINTLGPGICFTIAAGCRFQFRASKDGPLRVVAATMPPWPGADEADEVEAHWIDTMR